MTPVQFRDALLERARGLCEVPRVAVDTDVGLVTICGTSRAHDGCDAHHVWPEDRDAKLHDPERGLLLCRAAHRWVHEHPTLARQARLLRPDRSPVDGGAGKKDPPER